MRLPLGLILMVLGIIGIARGAVEAAQIPPVNQVKVGASTTVGDATELPLVSLAAALLFVGGLIILAKRDEISALDSGRWESLPKILPRPAAGLHRHKSADVSSY